MPNILINGVKSKTGGGKSIFQTYLKMAREEDSDRKYFVLTPNFEEYSEFGNEKMTIIDIPDLAKSNLLFPLLYFYYFPKLIKEFNIDAILNYGDIVIPGSTPQLYNFDWPHAAYPYGLGWNAQSIQDKAISHVKLIMFKKFLSSASIIMAQTEVMSERLRTLYHLNNVEIVPNAVSLDNFKTREDRMFNLPAGYENLLYLTFYYPHKNIEVFIEIARIIKARSLPFKLITTLAPEHHPMAAKFLHDIKAQELDSIICNIGPVPMTHIASLYEQCSGLLMPTLLESFSGSYVEAMFHRRPIFTSNMEFARGVCGDAAYYFDPMNAAEIVDILVGAYSDKAGVDAMVARGSAQLSTMWDWERVFSRTQQLLSNIMKA